MGVNRRSFLKGAGAAIGAASVARAEDENAPDKADVLDVDEPVEVRIDLNNAPCTLRVLPDTPIAHAVRELGLTGTKLSCEGGACGACTLHADGAPRSGCLTLAVELEGARLTTIEGVGSPDALHPIQRAILETDALQCGFCTPGFVMAAVAFFDRWKAQGLAGRPPRDDVAQALAGNLCRCGCQPALLEAVAAACAGERARAPGGAVVHEERALPRVDGPEKVCGRARYTVDVQMPRMLHGAFVRSKVPHGVIQRIDTARAKRVPGVVDVDLWPIARDKGWGKLRFVGQPIAVVLAENEAAARAGARAVDIDVAQLPFVVEHRDALAANAPLVWAPEERGDVPAAGESPKEPEFLRRWEGNVRRGLVFEKEPGEHERAVHDDGVRVELHVHTEVQMHATLERHGCVASWDGAELTLHTGTQTLDMVASDLAEHLELPRAKVRVLSEHTGGAFGSKAGLRPEHVVAARASMRWRRPVRIIHSFADHLLVGGNRPGTNQRLRVGASLDGRVRAVEHHSQSMCGIAVGERSTGLTTDHLPRQTRAIVDENVVTHTAPACAFRAPGFPPNCFSLEQAVDEVAARVKRHPLVVRLAGDDDDVRRKVYRVAIEKMGPVRERAGTGHRFMRGTGIATAEWWVLAAPSCTVELRAHRTGHVEVSTAIHDLGQGARTVLLNLVHDELGLPKGQIHTRVGDSRLVPGTGAFGSLTTPSVAPPTLAACAQLRALLVKGARRMHGDCRETPTGVLVGRKLVPWRELFVALDADPVVVLGRRGDDPDGYKLPPTRLGALAAVTPVAISQDIVASVQVADVEVDRHLGRVRVRKIDVFLDAGRIASPVTARTQVVGGVIQGMSRALYEARQVGARSGVPLSRSFDAYAILGVADAPEVEVHFVEASRTHNPAGALGLGENSTIATCAAIANGVYRATGRRVMQTPVTPAHLLEVLA